MQKDVILRYIYSHIKTNHNLNAAIDSNLKYDLDLDSLDTLDLATALEEEYNIVIDDDDIIDWKTVEDVANTVYKLLK